MSNPTFLWLQYVWELKTTFQTLTCIFCLRSYFPKRFYFTSQRLWVLLRWHVWRSTGEFTCLRGTGKGYAQWGKPRDFSRLPFSKTDFSECLSHYITLGKMFSLPKFLLLHLWNALPSWQGFLKLNKIIEEQYALQCKNKWDVANPKRKFSCYGHL